MGDRLRGKFANNTRLSKGDVEDVWSEMLMRVVQAPAPNRLPADADRWTDPRLQDWLERSFNREIWRAAKRAATSDGVRRSSPLDDLQEQTYARGVMWGDAAPPTPENAIFERLDALEYAQGIESEAGPRATRMMFADALGASPAELQQLLDINTARPYRTLRDRLEAAGTAMARRVQAVVLWFVPDRWIAALFSTGQVPRVGVVGLVVAAVAAGGAGVTTATRPQAAKPHPVVAHVAAQPLQATRIPLQQIALRQRATEQRRARVVLRHRAQVRRRAATQRQAAARRRSEAAAAARTADRQFAPSGINASPASAARAPARPATAHVSTSDRATGDAAFGLGN